MVGSLPSLAKAYAPEHRRHCLGTKAASHEKAVLPCPLGEIGGRTPEAPLPGLPGEVGLGTPQLRQRFGTELTAEPVLGEFLLKASHAIPRPTTTHQTFDEPLVAQQALLDQPIEQRLERIGFGRVGGQLAGEFETAVLASREMAQRPRPQRERVSGGPPADQAASSAPPRWLTPKCSRTLFSISRASSGCSRRYSRALSLPWPTRSP